VIENEKITVTEDGMQAVIQLSCGDMRKALNILQSTSMSADIVNEESVYTCTGHPLKRDIQSIVEWMLQEDFHTAQEKIHILKQMKGLALQDILTEVHDMVQRIEFPPKIKIALLESLSEVEYRLSSGTNERIQMSSMIAAFNITKSPIVAMAT